MTFGAEIYNASGVRTLSVTTRLTRLVYTRFLPANESSSVSVSGFDSATHVAMVVPRLPSFGPTSSRAGHAISISGTTISWAPGDPIYRADSDLLVFAYR